jgi:hypothetical protein
VQDNDLKNNSVTARAIRTDAVREAEIQAGAVQDAELGTIVSRKDTTAIPTAAPDGRTCSATPASA